MSHTKVINYSIFVSFFCLFLAQILMSHTDVINVKMELDFFINFVPNCLHWHPYTGVYLSISRKRANVSSRPSDSMTSNIPGDTADPVKAARNGCATAPNLTE